MSIKNWLSKVFKPLSLKNKQEKGDNVMSAETEQKKEEETLTKAEAPQSEETAKGNEVAESQPQNENTNVENQENNGETQQNDETIEETQDVVQVEDTTSSGNGISIDDLVTKTELTDRLSSLEAKFDAVVKENQDLKDKLTEMQDKYENKNFGNMNKKGVEVNKDNFETFDSYSRQFE